MFVRAMHITDVDTYMPLKTINFPNRAHRETHPHTHEQKKVSCLIVNGIFTVCTTVNQSCKNHQTIRLFVYASENEFIWQALENFGTFSCASGMSNFCIDTIELHENVHISYTNICIYLRARYQCNSHPEIS